MSVPPPTAPAWLIEMRERLAADRQQNHPAGCRHVLSATSIVFELRPADILGRHRYRELVEARFAFFWTARHRLGSDYAEMGRRLRGRDHTTALHGARRASELRARNPGYAAKLAEIEALVWPRGWTHGRIPPNYRGRPEDPWRSRQVLGEIAKGVETAPAVAAALGCGADAVRSALCRLEAGGAVAQVGAPPLPGTPGAYRRYRLADPVA